MFDTQTSFSLQYYLPFVWCLKAFPTTTYTLFKSPVIVPTTYLTTLACLFYHIHNLSNDSNLVLVLGIRHCILWVGEVDREGAADCEVHIALEQLYSVDEQSQMLYNWCRLIRDGEMYWVFAKAKTLTEMKCLQVDMPCCSWAMEVRVCGMWPWWVDGLCLSGRSQIDGQWRDRESVHILKINVVG
jgi:hypothetical protein